MPIMGGCSVDSLFRGPDDVIDLRNALNSSAANANEALSMRRRSFDWAKWLFASRLPGQNSAQSAPELPDDFSILFRRRR
jgi:hypothetical protein